MRNLILLVFLFSAFRINAIEVDSVQRQKFIQEGRAELCNLLEYNTHVASPADRKYVVVIDGDPNAINYTVEKNVQGNTEDILSQESVDSINATLSRTYASYGIEMYVIMMKSFNFVVKAPLPNLPSSTQLFTHHLYDEESNIAELRAIHQQLTNEITYNTFSAHGRDCLVYSRADYTGAYVPGKIGTWTLSKRIPYYAQFPTYPKLAELTDYYYDRIKEDPNVINAGLELSLRNAAKEFWESAKYMALKNQIMTTLHTQQMSQIFQQFNESVDYQNLTEAERIHALGVFAGYPMYDNGLGQQERYTCKIIEYTPKEQVSGFLTQLSQVSPLNTTVGFIGDKPDQALIITLIDKMDDVGPGGDNYTRMMRGLASIAMSDESFATAHMPQTSQQWLDRRIYWDDWSVMETAPIGTHDYDVTMSSDAKVQVNLKVVKRWDSDTGGRQESIRYTEVWESYDPYSLNPFDLVVFTNRSSLGMLQVAGAAPHQPFLAPAIFLKYADDKAFNTNSITVTAIAIDIVAIATGPFAIGGALAAGNVAIAAYEALQLMGSVANLVANQNTSPEFQEAVTTFNIVVGGWGLANIAVAGTKYAVGYLDAALNGTIRPVPLTTASEYCAKYDAVTNWSGVDEATKTRMGKLRQVLGEEVAAGTIQSTTQFSRATLDALIGFENNIADLAARYNLTLEEFIILEEKASVALTPSELSIVNSIRNAIPHPTATTLMQKVIPKCDITKYLDGTYTSCKGFLATAEDAKHLQTFEDIYWGLRLDYANTTFNLSDGSCGAIRFRAKNSSTAIIPKSIQNGGTFDSPMPFTGHGFTSGNHGRLGAPEWFLGSFAEMENGAELWEVYSNGTEVLRGVYNKDALRFYPIN